MNKLVEKFEKINSRMLSQHGNAISSAEEAKKLAVEFSKYLRTNNYLPQISEDRSIGYVIARECWRSDKPADVHSADEVFDKFINEYYK